MFSDLRQGIMYCKTKQGGLNTRCFMSHYDFRMGCDPPPPFCNRVVQKYKVVHLQLWFQNRVCDPPPLLQQDGSNKKVYFPMILNNNNINWDHYLTCRLPPQEKRTKFWRAGKRKETKREGATWSEKYFVPWLLAQRNALLLIASRNSWFFRKQSHTFRQFCALLDCVTSLS